MKRLNYKTLILDDNDLDCKKKEPTLEEINLSAVGFVLSDLATYDLIIYKGKLGFKIIKIKGGA